MLYSFDGHCQMCIARSVQAVVLKMVKILGTENAYFFRYIHQLAIIVMSSKNLLLSLPASALLLATTAADAGFMAFNDLASSVPNEYDGTNVTFYSLGDSDGLLKDIHTGEEPGYTLSVIGDSNGDANVSSTTGNGNNPVSGDAYEVFGDVVNMVRYIQGSGGAGYVDLVFAGLLSHMLYEVVVYGERSPATDGRPTAFTISGADSFNNKSSAGASFAGPSDPSVSYATAPNFDPGLMAYFTDINPGIDGTFSIRVDDPTPQDGQNWYVNAVAFGEVPAPAPVALFAIGVAALGLGRRSQRR
jgi:hypothetical protein